jgi:MoxR-like ATPase
VSDFVPGVAPQSPDGEPVPMANPLTQADHLPQAGPGPEVELLPDAALPDELVAPTSETLATPTPDASAAPTSEALAAPASEALAAPTSEALVAPTSAAAAAPTSAPAPGTPAGAETTPAQDASLLERALFEVKRVIVGQDKMIERMLVAVLARGHCLLEGVPGVAKTLAVETLATVVGGTFARIQFTPDLVPADIVGTRIFRASREQFDVELGPVFVNFLLADEINRAPAKVQSALLEVMAEQQVSIGGETYEVPLPFLVMATQNPIEQEGVYQLPEAQRDRFLLKIVVGYPTDVEEREIVYRVGVRTPQANQVLDPAQLARLQSKADTVFVHNALVDYAVRLVFATRSPALHGMPDVAQLIQYGASPRASLGIVRAARALALMRGRDYALPQDMVDIAPDILRHRLVLSYDALADDISADQVVDRVLGAVPLPSVAPRQQATPVATPGEFVARPDAPGAAAPPALPAWPRRN